jgi:serine/threonine-protein kinase
MLGSPDSVLLPTIVADLADASAVDALEEVAKRNGTVYIPLNAAPVDHDEHLLEVYVPGARGPLKFIARPIGPPSEAGFPLALRSCDSTRSKEDLPTDERAAPAVAARRSTQHKLSEAHAADLSAVKREAPKDTDLTGRSIAGGKLVLSARLGSGGVGAVYRATHRDLNKEVAVKVLRDGVQSDLEFCQRFHAEARAASSLDHPNLIRVFDFGQEPDGLLYISMEFIKGGSLQDVLDNEKRLTTERATAIMIQVAGALSHAHGNGVVHRDIKPANIMLVDGFDDDGHATEIPKVCDFGLALQTATAEKERYLAGTPEYMSPEQLLALPVDGRADMYACGVVLYELVTGRLPFDGSTAQEYARQHLHSAPPPPGELVPDLDTRLEEVILRALAKDPKDRYASMREMRIALKAVVSPIPSLTPPPMQVAVSTPKPGGVSRADWIEDSRSTYDNFFASQSGPSSQRSPPPNSAPPASAPPPSVRAVPTTSAPPRSFSPMSVRAQNAAPNSVAPKSVPSASVAPKSDPARDAEALALDIAKAPAEVLDKIAALRADPRFPAVTQMLEGAAKVLARRGDAAALRKIVRTMTGIYADETQRLGALGSAGASAVRVLHAVADPATLKVFAEQLFADVEDPSEGALGLFTWAEVAGAHALYGARTEHDTPNARTRFVKAMRFLDQHAAPVVRAALEQRLPENASTISDVALAEDLLNSVPAEKDEKLGLVVARYARFSDTPAVQRAALEGLVRAWGARAIPLLLASLQSRDEGTCITALRGLAELGGVDETVVKKLDAVVSGAVAVSDALRVATVEAFAHAVPSAQPDATFAVLRTLNDDKAISNGEVVVALARAAMKLAPSEARERITALAAKAQEPLAEQLTAMAKR